MQPQPSALTTVDASPATESPGSLEARQVIDGRYIVRRLLAKGGGASVYAAEHRYTRRSVAMKVPLENSEGSIARVRREIDALTRVRGMGVVEMTDAAEVDGRPYIVFELLEGRTLAGLLTARGRLGIDHVVRIGIELCEALERCHTAGVIHRDVKPSNLFITLHPDRQLVLLDFGIAKIVASDAPAEKLTRECVLLGTPEYMAPESLLSSEEADHRVDVYGVGVVLYECLTGTVPFDGHYADVLLKISTQTPRPVSELRPETPSDLARVIMKCLGRTPEDRYPTMAALVAALRACASKQVSSVRLLAGLLAPTPGNAEDTPTLEDSPSARAVPHPASRRKHPRAPYTTLARITLPSGERVDGRVEEVSEGGLQFVGERAVTVGEIVSIRFGLPATGRIVEVSATARWNRTMRGTNAMGFQFHDLPDHGRAEIASYVAIMCSDAA